MMNAQRKEPLFIALLGLEQIYRARAWQTAERIARFHHLPVQPLEGIIDMSFGDWEGHAHEEIKEKDGETYLRWRKEPHLAQLPGGETLDDVRERAMASLKAVIKRHPGETLVLVSHRVVNKVLLCGILGIDNSHFWQISQDTTAINLIQHRNGQYTLSLMNETCHLKSMGDDSPRVDF